MTFCNSCGFDKGSGRYCPKCGSMSDQAPTGVEANQNSGITGGGPTPTSFQPGTSASYATPFASPALSGQKSSGSTAFGISLLALGAIGVLSTFLPWLAGNGEAANGWKLRDWMVEAELFSAGAILVAVGSAATLLVAIILLANKSNAVNRFGLGIGLLVAGFVSVGGAGGTYNELTKFFSEDSVNEILGAGWILGTLVGFAGIIAGVLAMAIKPLTGSK